MGLDGGLVVLRRMLCGCAVGPANGQGDGKHEKKNKKKKTMKMEEKVVLWKNAFK